MKRLILSIVIATYNSEKTLDLSLKAIQKQTIPKNSYEILIVDGGSNDKTLSIARKFHCRIIHNPLIEPTNAKYLGFRKAKGIYISYIDHDEVMLNPDSLKYKLEVLQKHPTVKAAIGSGYKDLDNAHILTRYINEFGDPFSFFIYHLTKNTDFFFSTMKKRYKIIENSKTYAIFDLSSSSRVSLFELGAAGGVIEKNFTIRECGELVDLYKFIPTELTAYYSQYPLVAVIKNDNLLHFSSDTYRGYVNKIVWRIKNNIFHSAQSETPAYARREKSLPINFRIKKYLYVPYAFSLILPLFDSIYLMITRKDSRYIVHMPLTVLTASLIIYYQFLKWINLQTSRTSYDGSAKVYETTGDRL